MFNSYYYEKEKKGKDHVLIFRNPQCPPKRSWDGSKKKAPKIKGEQLLLDVNQIADENDHCSLGSWTISKDEKFMAFAIDTTGSTRFDIFIKDLDHDIIIDKIVGQPAGCDLAFSTSGCVLYYLLMNKNERSNRMMKHVIGSSDNQKDILLYEETDERFNLNMEFPHPRTYVLLNSHSEKSCEWRYISADDDDNNHMEIIFARKQGVDYEVGYWSPAHSWMILDNSCECVNFRLLCIPVDKRKIKYLKDSGTVGDLSSVDPSSHLVLGHNPNVHLTELDCFESFVIVTCRDSGFLKIYCLSASSTVSYSDWKLRIIPFPVENCEVSLSEDNHLYDSSVVRIDFCGLTTPPVVYDVDLSVDPMDVRSLEKEEREYEYSSFRYEVESFYDEGVHIPISVVYKKHGCLDRKLVSKYYEREKWKRGKEWKRPVMVRAYAAYGECMELGFVVEEDVGVMLDRGWVLVLAHVRGGGEKGRNWYLDGKGERKENGVRDVVSVCRFLADEEKCEEMMNEVMVLKKEKKKKKKKKKKRFEETESDDSGEESSDSEEERRTSRKKRKKKKKKRKRKYSSSSFSSSDSDNYDSEETESSGEEGKDESETETEDEEDSKSDDDYDSEDESEEDIGVKFGHINLYGVSCGGVFLQCLNLYPSLFRSAVFEVPFVDILNTMMDETLPLTMLEYEEWGNPSTDKKIFEAMSKYSPCQNIHRAFFESGREKNVKKKMYYPDLFLLGGMKDKSVQYWEPLKFCAKLRDMMKNGPYKSVVKKGEEIAREKRVEEINCSKILLNMSDVGHYGTGGKMGLMKETAAIYAFFIDRNADKKIGPKKKKKKKKKRRKKKK